jgi:hypothetical protein
MTKGWENESLRHSLAAKGVTTSSKKTSIIEIAEKKISHREWALWHAAQARKELRKKSPDYVAIQYHLGQARMHNKFKPFYVLQNQVKK